MDRKWKILALVSIGDFMAFLDAPVVSVAFPDIQATFPGTATTTTAWVLDIYFIGFAACLVASGRIADRFGRRRVFITGMWLFALASLACAVAPSLGLLIAARAFQAAAAALVVPSGQGLMLDAFPPAERKAAIGVLGAIVGLAILAAPAFGGVVVDLIDWTWIFYFNVIIVGATAVVAMYALREKDRPEDAPFPDMLGGLLQAAAISLLVLAILRRSEWGTIDARTIGAVVIAIAAAGLFIRRSRSHPAPLIDLDLFRNRTFAIANASAFVFSIGFFGATVTSVLFMTSVWGYDVLQAGLAFGPGSLVAALSAAPAGRLAERYGSWPVSFVGCLLSAAGLALIVASIGTTSHFLTDWVPGQVVYSLGVSLALTGLVGAALTAVPPAQFGLASGVNSALRQVGGAIGVALSVAIIAEATSADPLGSYQTALVVTAGALLAAAPIALAMRSFEMSARQQLTAEAAQTPPKPEVS